MSKTEKLLAILAVVLTIVAVAFWVINLTSEDKDEEKTDTAVTQDPSPNSGIGINNSGDFNLTPSESETFSFDFVSVDGNTVNVILNGSTQDVSTAELVLSYNPSEVTITSVEDGTLFDLYLSNERIDAENGLIKLAGAFTSETSVSKTQGVFATIKFNKLVSSPAILSIVDYDDEMNEFSRLVNFNNTTFSIKSTEITL